MSAYETLDRPTDDWGAATDAATFVASGIAALTREWADPPAGCPLVAVAGVCGGAGTTTVAYLTAIAAGEATTDAIAVGDLGGPGATLAELAGADPGRSLSGLADAAAAHAPTADRLFDRAAGPGPRVLAGRPAVREATDRAGLDRVLAELRRAHSLAVVDCGVPDDDGARQVLDRATHLLWVLPATAHGVRRGRALLDLFPAAADRRELLVARHQADAGRPAVDGLKALAGERGAPLVLLPEVGDLATGDVRAAAERAGVGLDAILMAVRR